MSTKTGNGLEVSAPGSATGKRYSDASFTTATSPYLKDAAYPETADTVAAGLKYHKAPLPAVDPSHPASHWRSPGSSVMVLFY